MIRNEHYRGIKLDWNELLHNSIAIIGSRKASNLELEKAYYLSYRNNRSTYIDKWFNVINWDKAEENYKNPIN